jgi:hypothetical protein
VTKKATLQVGGPDSAITGLKVLHCLACASDAQLEDRLTAALALLVPALGADAARIEVRGADHDRVPSLSWRAERGPDRAEASVETSLKLGAHATLVLQFGENPPPVAISPNLLLALDGIEAAVMRWRSLLSIAVA